MRCPFCPARDTKVIDSRLVADGGQVRRRRACQSCGARFNTHEAAELTLPKVVKRDGAPEPFDEAKLRGGLFRALEKRPVAAEDIEAAIAGIKRALYAGGEREVKSRHVGELVMAALRGLDEVAYVRFASVYRAFQHVSDFQAEIERLQDAGPADENQKELSAGRP